MKYNLLTEKWIPVETTYFRQEKMSMKDALEKSHEIIGISEQDPGYQLGLYLLLINIIADIYRPQNIYEILDIYDKKEFDTTIIENYFASCGENRFDLFDENYPFLQYFGDVSDENKIGTIATLTSNLPHGFNMLHKTNLTEDTIDVTVDEVAKALIASYITTPGSGEGKASIQYDAIQTFILKPTLFETITCNLPICAEYDFDKAPAPWRRNDNEVNLIEYSPLSYFYVPYRFLKLIWKDGKIFLYRD